MAVGLHHHSALFCVFGNQARRQLGADAGSHSRSCVSIVHSVVGDGGDEEQPPEEEGEPLSHETAIMGLIIVSCFFQLPFSFIAVASSSTIFKDQQCFLPDDQYKADLQQQHLLKQGVHYTK